MRRGCAPSKISVSDVIAIKPSGILLPTKFDTIAQTHLNKAIKSLDNLIPGRAIGSEVFTEITLENAIAILDAIEPTLVLDDEGSFEWEAMKGLLRYYASKPTEGATIGRVGKAPRSTGFRR